MKQSRKTKRNIYYLPKITEPSLILWKRLFGPWGFILTNVLRKLRGGIYAACYQAKSSYTFRDPHTEENIHLPIGWAHACASVWNITTLTLSKIGINTFLKLLLCMAALSSECISPTRIKRNLAIISKFIFKSYVKSSLTLIMLLLLLFLCSNPLHEMMWTIHKAVISHRCSQHIEQNNPFQICAKVRTVCFSRFPRVFISWFSLHLA